MKGTNVSAPFFLAYKRKIFKRKLVLKHLDIVCNKRKEQKEIQSMYSKVLGKKESKDFKGKQHCSWEGKRIGRVKLQL